MSKKLRVLLINKGMATLLVAVLVVAETVIAVLLSVSLMGDGKNIAILDYTVVIDAGHGGIDAGVTSNNGTKESELNLSYAKTLGQYFADGGFNVKYTRTDDGGLYGLPTKGFKMRDMQARRDIIAKSGADIVISVHMNKYPYDSSRKGPQVFFQSNDEQGKALANSVQLALNDMTGNSHEALAGDFYICRTSEMPAVIVECGFLSNAEEEQLLLSDEYRDKLSMTIYRGVMLYLYSL